jgi:hypothetical protein
MAAGLVAPVDHLYGTIKLSFVDPSKHILGSKSWSVATLSLAVTHADRSSGYDQGYFGLIGHGFTPLLVYNIHRYEIALTRIAQGVRKCAS